MMSTNAKGVTRLLFETILPKLVDGRNAAKRVNVRTTSTLRVVCCCDPSVAGQHASGETRQCANQLPRGILLHPAQGKHAATMFIHLRTPMQSRKKDQCSSHDAILFQFYQYICPTAATASGVLRKTNVCESSSVCDERESSVSAHAAK